MPPDRDACRECETPLQTRARTTHPAAADRRYPGPPAHPGKCCAPIRGRNRDTRGRVRRTRSAETSPGKSPVRNRPAAGPGPCAGCRATAGDGRHPRDPPRTTGRGRAAVVPRGKCREPARPAAQPPRNRRRGAIHGGRLAGAASSRAQTTAPTANPRNAARVPVSSIASSASAAQTLASLPGTARLRKTTKSSQVAK